MHAEYAKTNFRQVMPEPASILETPKTKEANPQAIVQEKVFNEIFGHRDAVVVGNPEIQHDILGPYAGLVISRIMWADYVMKPDDPKLAQTLYNAIDFCKALKLPTPQVLTVENYQNLAEEANSQGKKITYIHAVPTHPTGQDLEQFMQREYPETVFERMYPDKEFTAGENRQSWVQVGDELRKDIKDSALKKEIYNTMKNLGADYKYILELDKVVKSIMPEQVIAGLPEVEITYPDTNWKMILNQLEDILNQHDQHSVVMKFNSTASGGGVFVFTYDRLSQIFIKPNGKRRSDAEVEKMLRQIFEGDAILKLARGANGAIVSEAYGNDETEMSMTVLPLNAEEAKAAGGDLFTQAFSTHNLVKEGHHVGNVVYLTQTPETILSTDTKYPNERLWIQAQGIAMLVWELQNRFVSSVEEFLQRPKKPYAADYRRDFVSQTQKMVDPNINRNTSPGNGALLLAKLRDMYGEFSVYVQRNAEVKVPKEIYNHSKFQELLNTHLSQSNLLNYGYPFAPTFVDSYKVLVMPVVTPGQSRKEAEDRFFAVENLTKDIVHQVQEEIKAIQNQPQPQN